ncbi:MAG TPA: tetratricopeptide repeat protein [Steroidobacteraceae bacterium]|jgi:predicted O-linked N-acetylglucosamine transferase (SPINDLY family)
MAQQGSPGIAQLFALALQHHQAGRLSEAEKLYWQVLRTDSHHADALHFLGVIAHQQQRSDVAIDLINQAIAQNGQVPAFHTNLGNALKARGRLDDAVAAYRRALALKPDHAAAHYNLGVVLEALGNLDEAAAAYARAVALNPKHTEAHNNLGNALRAQGQIERALESYRRALALKPNLVEAHNNLGNVYRSLGRLEDALSSYRTALQHQPDYAQAHNNLGIVLLDQGKLADAEASFRRALALRADYAEAYVNLGNALTEQGDCAQAQATYQQALAIDPDCVEARLGLALAVIPIFAANAADSDGAATRFARSLKELTSWSRANPGKLGKTVGSHQPFYLAYRPGELGPLLSRYGELVCAEAASHWQSQLQAPSAESTPRTRTRLLIISGQVRHHPVWDVVLRGIIAHIDRARFEVLLYHTGALVDKETDWAKAQVERFVAGPKPTRAWLAEIARDRPDAIFYPEIGMDPATCTLAALRLAPLQLAGWGHPVTTGLPSMDLYLSGELLESATADQHYRERLLRLPGTGVCTELSAAQGQPWDGPARPADVVRFALCQQPIKFDPQYDALLARIAKAAGPSEFWLVASSKQAWANERLRARLAAAFRAEGLDPEAHLRVTPWMRPAAFLGYLDAMDVYLDCPAFSGYTTAWQAIHRGLPIVTLEGEYQRQRLAAGLLRQIQITDGVASTGDQYLDIAVRLAAEARDPQQRDARRQAITAAAPRADGNRAAVAAFEQALIGGLHTMPSKDVHGAA